ncbi:MAG: hypothetical protein ACPLSM_01670 [Thermosphaera sp.]
MSQSPSRLVDLDVALISAIALASIIIKAGVLSQGYFAGLALSIILINLLFLARIPAELSDLLIVYSGILLATCLCEALVDYFPGFNVEIMLSTAYILLILLILNQFHAKEGFSHVATPLLPVGVLASIIAGVYLGVDKPLLLIVLGLIDAFSAIPVFESKKRVELKLAITLLAFLTLYSQPFVNMGLPALLVLLGLHLARNAYILLAKHRAAGLILVFDLALRPFAVVLA